VQPKRENRLSRDYINALPVIRFNGEVVLVDQEEQAEEIIGNLGQEEYVGFDTESRPSFKKGVAYPISLIQIATGDTAYLFHSIANGFPEPLWDFLANEDIKKIGVGLQGDMEKLKEFSRFRAGGFIDLSNLAAQKGIIQTGARALTARYLKRRLVKSSQRTNWANSNLSGKQKIYAATDAWICLKIYPLLLADPHTYDPEEE
jgi:ribonuclease D